MNDEEMLTAMRSSLTSIKDSLTDVHMHEPPEAIIGRARSRRLRHGLPMVAAGGLALGVGLALTWSSVSSPSTRAVHVNLAAWSVNTTSAGLVDVTIRQLEDPAGLGRTIADAGVPVKVTFGRVCSPPSGDLPELPQVLRKVANGGDLVLTINPAAMPSGTELVIGIGTFRQGSQQVRAAAFSLIKDGSSLNCNDTQNAPGTGGTKAVS